jgi:hypothetical protein
VPAAVALAVVLAVTAAFHMLFLALLGGALWHDLL